MIYCKLYIPVCLIPACLLLTYRCQYCSALLRATAARYVRFRPHPPFVTSAFFQVSVRSPSDYPPG